MGALRPPLSCSHSSLTLYDSLFVRLPDIVAITPTFCAACTLSLHCYYCLTLCCHLSTLCSLAFLSGMIVSMVSSRTRLWISVWCYLLASSIAVVSLLSFPS
jgi:hypothetical protein